MKRAERHQLKENEIQLRTRQAREAVAARKRETTAAVVAVVVIGAIALGYFGWRGRVQSRAHAMLADAMVVHDARVAPVAAELAPGSKPAPTTGTFPTEQARAEAALVKLKATADKYPSSDAGIYARYQQAATLMSLGRFTEAASCYEQVVSRSGD